ncbi:glycoside hydrolase [Rhizoclosmatium globosum]|uniref:Glycoside hydrolase n=1 Tax=Rhizoclosmatium globosum TaxID=329046 RepID=A0A1Y2CR30_9FUNG|nr:glycoside hydrolase [Rhizoclosmatium globosum]|eukprot:ORY49472.1 glycoside hydrolase [Rhizoclosmatium globosum]
MTSTGRNVYLRLAPEMNGEWFVYGKQPDAFIALWKRAYSIVNKISPTVAFVWSPNFNGPSNDEPYEPYWPGADYVDWVGVSVYWKGSIYDFPWIHNTNAPSDYVAQLIDAAPGPEGGPDSIYQYAVRYNKPFVISECASTFHMGKLNADGSSTPLDAGIGRTQTIMSFWNSFLFNPTFLANYPLLKMVFAFEMFKVEDNNTENDYRATVDASTLAAFSAGLKQLDASGAVQWASGGRGIPVAPGAPAVATSSNRTLSTISVSVTATISSDTSTGSVSTTIPVSETSSAIGSAVAANAKSGSVSLMNGMFGFIATFISFLIL